MRKVLWALVGLALSGCGAASDGGYEVIYRGSNTPPNVSASEDRQDLARANTRSIEAPREVIAAMQLCADRFAPKLHGESFAVFFDVTVGATGNTAKVKDSMLDGSPLEHCLATALERMDTSVAVNLQPNVSPQSRSAVGVVQALAAPIALAPIALTAAGVTILIGVTIYVATGGLNDSVHCREVKQDCIVTCNRKLPTGDFGFRFWNCVNKCMRTAGC